MICLSGGVPPQLEIVQTALRQGITVSNDSLLTMQLARQRRLGPLIAITGSSGKTTTTTLSGLMLATTACDHRQPAVHVGGNIGRPLIDRLDEIRPGEPIVLELSSFQLELFDPAIAWGEFSGIGPDVAAILNITPNHLDRHPDMAAYARAKFNLLRHLPPAATVVLNGDDVVTSKLGACPTAATGSKTPASWGLEPALAETQAALHTSHPALVCVSRQEALSTGAWLDRGTLYYNGHPFAQQAEIKLRGDHNISNLLAAAAISGAAGATVKAMHQVATTFSGVPHRLEIVTERDGVLWINDSIATSPERAVAALRSFTAGQQTLILLAGGKDKNLPWEGLADEALQRVNVLIGFGQAGAMVVGAVQERARYRRQQAPNAAVVQRLDEAVELAERVAQLRPTRNHETTNGPHTVVLLSPGGTSYDAYKDFEARGEHFRKLVARCTSGQ